MNVLLVAPCHVPLMIGGSEKLWWGMLDHLNRHTPHHADIVKLPGPEGNFWEVVDSYRHFSELDLRPYEVIVSGKYPAWMVDHPNHVCYFQHPLRGLYDTYPGHLPDRLDAAHPDLRALTRLLRGPDHSRQALAECFERVARLRSPRRLGRRAIPKDAFAFPGPLIREVVQFCDRVALAPGAIQRLCTISSTVAGREGYFRPGTEPTVVHHPSDLSGFPPPRPGRYLFSVSRLEEPKRIDLLIDAMRHVSGEAELWIAGTGPDQERLRQLASGDPRIRLLGFVNDDRLLELYAEALAVVFVPLQEDLGLVTLEAMNAAKPVITVNDAGGPCELVQDGVSGYITEPGPEAIAARMQELLGQPELAARMGERGAGLARTISWERVCSTLLSGLGR